ncbi:formylglycine-generating enzyme family protein [Spartinivicinus ruber]|uniref:formylglycine-generating enzyme family protein n=1 Tax=Spartinivicinus ruber TaxID=2683272 RepID=UPI0013D5BA9C|nr:formylglycine-generating enzyme family protein [Spartinivicinus ruber]
MQLIHQFGLLFSSFTTWLRSSRASCIVIACILLIACDNSSRSALAADVDDVIKNIESNMMFVKGGAFIMGDQDEEYIKANPKAYLDRYAHEVTLSDFYISKYEVTKKEFYVYVKASKVKRKASDDYKTFEKITSDDHPISSVTWHEALAFCHWIGSLTGKKYTLPTEAQWEYAARSRGKAVEYATNNGKLQLGINIENRFQGVSHKVNKYQPNELGIYNMQGNVAEWTKDFYNKNYFKNSPSNDPQGAILNKQQHRVVRGSSFDEKSQLLYYRNSYPQTKSTIGIGFRCVINT